MYHQRIRPAHEVPAAVIHPAACSCFDCSSNHDPIGHARARRLLCAQAFGLIFFAATLYLVVAVNYSAIAAAMRDGH